MRILAQLEKDGWLTVNRKAAADHKGNTYNVALGKLVEVTGLPSHLSPPSQVTPESPESGKVSGHLRQSQVTFETESGDISSIAIRNNDQEPSLNQPSGASAFCLPDWIPVEPWNAFLEMRKKQRASPTPYATEKLVKKLENLRDDGCDLTEVLDQSTVNAWKGIFEPKENRNGHTAIPARTQQNSAALRGFREHQARQNRQPGDSNR
jgi:hypothetical protein